MEMMWKGESKRPKRNGRRTQSVEKGDAVRCLPLVNLQRHGGRLGGSLKGLLGIWHWVPCIFLAFIGDNIAERYLCIEEFSVTYHSIALHI